jgi:hypothetical protein
MEELHSRWASPPQAAFCAAVNAAAGSGVKDAIRASPKKVAKAIVARFSDILFPVFSAVGTVSLSHASIGKALGPGLAGAEARRGLAHASSTEAAGWIGNDLSGTQPRWELCLMALTMRPTGLGSGVDKDRPDVSGRSGAFIKPAAVPTVCARSSR